MTEKLTNAENLARAMLNFMSGGRVLRRQLAEQTRDELRSLAAENARLRRERDEARDRALVEAAERARRKVECCQSCASVENDILALRTAPPPTEAPDETVLEQSETLDGRVAQTVRFADGKEIVRVVSAAPEEVRERVARAIWEELGSDFTFDEAVSDAVCHAAVLAWIRSMADAAIAAIRTEASS